MYAVAQPGGECILSSDFIWAVTTDYICLLIEWFAVENREPLMVKFKRRFDGVSGYERVGVCACLTVFACGLEVYCEGENVRFALEETPCSSSQVISFRLWNLPLKGYVIDRMHWSHLLPTYEKAL